LSKKKIVFLTGTRADFGKLKPLIEKIEDSKSFDCYVFVTGMHTLSKYGSTFNEVINQGYKDVFIFMNQTHLTDPDFILANTVTGFGNFVKEINPDLILIHGDRIEALAGAIVGTFNNILVSHVEGGETSGTIDEIIRHTITKISHLHFVANPKAKKRLIQMGEKKDSIFVIGSPDIDIMLSKKLPSLSYTKEHYNIQFKNYGILIFHPVTTELDLLPNEVSNLVSAVLESKKNYVVIFPNNDNGAEIILQEYERLKNRKNFKIFPSLRFEFFLTLLKNADFIIGNSSAGIRESGVYGIPSINVGTRQMNRSKNKNIQNPKVNVDEILKSINRINEKRLKPDFEFGAGDSSEKFFQTLTSKKIWSTTIQKHFVDIN
jgi:UDP-N-acetylglucosamine 2-epimerase (hydrolysing)